MRLLFDKVWCFGVIFLVSGIENVVLMVFGRCEVMVEVCGGIVRCLELSILWCLFEIGFFFDVEKLSSMF